MIRRTMSRSGSPTVRRSTRSSALRRANRSSASREYGASPGESSASPRAAISAGSMPSAIPMSWSPNVAASRGPLPASEAARRPSSRRSRGPIAQRGPVSRVSSAALAVTSLSRWRVATTSATSGRRIRPERPTISTGTSRAVSASNTSAAWALSRVSTPTSDHFAPPSALVGGLDLVGQPGELVGLGPEHPGGHVALPGVGLGGEAHDLAGVLGVERLGQPVGDLEDAAVGAPTHGQRERGGPAAGRREGVGEVEDVGDRGSTPAVDRLVGVTDGGDGVPVAEEPGQHRGLGHRRVLVLVEQDHAELLPLHRPDIGLVDGEPGAQLDLVGEVHQAEVTLEAAVADHEGHQLAAPLDGVDRLGRRLEVGLAPLRGLLVLEGAQEGPLLLGVEGQHLLRRDEVLAHRAVEGEEVLDRGRRVVGEEPDLGRVALDHARAELVARGVGQHARVGLVADAQAVVGQQPGGVGVVGRHRRLDRVVPRFKTRLMTRLVTAS